MDLEHLINDVRKNLAPFFVSITIRAVSNKSEFRMDYNLAFCPGMLINAYFLKKENR